MDQREYMSCVLIGSTVLLPALLLKLIEKEKLKILEGLLNEKENQDKDPLVSRLRGLSKKNEGKVGIDQDVIKENPEFSDHLEVPTKDNLKESLLSKQADEEKDGEHGPSIQ